MEIYETVNWTIFVFGQRNLDVEFPLIVKPDKRWRRDRNRQVKKNEVMLNEILIVTEEISLFHCWYQFLVIDSTENKHFSVYVVNTNEIGTKFTTV